MRSIYKLIFLLAVSITMISCHKSIVDSPIGNKPPNTFISLFPDSTISQQTSRLKVSWWGDDPDGLVVGYYFKWEGIDSSWSFTTSSDSIFTLPIGSSDTTYNFLISAVDNSGNGVYDSRIVQNGIDYGPEPFIDENGNGQYDSGEKFFDIGLIDPSPAQLKFPIVNTPPVVSWNVLTVVPDTTFPVMTFAWNLSDLDGNETIVSVNISLNDTTNFVSLDGNTELVTLRPVDLNSQNPEMQILINGSESNIFPQNLSGIRLNDTNRIFIQAKDLSGSKSNIISLPDSGHVWYLKKPKGKFLVVNDYHTGTPSVDAEAYNFYINEFNTFDNGMLADKFEIYDFQNSPLPFENVTFPQTMGLFKYIFWFSSSHPKIDLMSLFTDNYLQNGGKIMYSMTLGDSASTFAFDLPTLRLFLPIDSLGQKFSISFLFPPVSVVPASPDIQYPELESTGTIGSARTFYPSITAQLIYNISSSQLNGPIGFLSNDKNLFFIGLPLHLLNGGGMNVNQFLEKVFIDEFNWSP